MAGFILVGGGFQDSAGNALAFGRMTAQLSHVAYPTASPTQMVCSGFVCDYPLDVSGNITITPPQLIWPNDLLTDIWNGLEDTYYMLTVYSATGQRAWGPNAIFVTSLGTMGFTTVQVVFTGGSPTFTLPNTPVLNSVTVYVNGLEQSSTVSGTTVSLSFTPQSIDVIVITYYISVAGLSPTMSQGIPSGTGTSLTLSTLPLAGTVMLYRNGLLEREGPDYSITGSNITLTVSRGSDSIYAVFQTSGSETLTASFQQIPSGVINGVNSTFTLASVTLVGNLQVFHDGLYQIGGGVDYTLGSDGRTITFTTAPGADDSVIYSDILNLINIGTFAPQNPA